jgi:hypothetical protein
MAKPNVAPKQGAGSSCEPRGCVAGQPPSAEHPQWPSNGRQTDSWAWETAMSKPDLLIVEFLREGGEIKRPLVCSARTDRRRVRGTYRNGHGRRGQKTSAKRSAERTDPDQGRVHPG